VSVCCVLSGRGICVGLITRPEDFYRLCCVVVCDLENLMNEESLAHWGAVAPKTATNFGWEGEWCSGLSVDEVERGKCSCS